MHTGFEPVDGGSVFLTSIKASTPINDGVECLGSSTRMSGLLEQVGPKCMRASDSP